MFMIDLWRVPLNKKEPEDYLGAYERLDDARMCSFADMLMRAGIDPKLQAQIMKGVDDDYVIRRHPNHKVSPRLEKLKAQLKLAS